MKIIRLIIALFLFLIMFNACKKENSSLPPVINLNASKTTNIQKGEPVTFTLPNVPAGDSVKWNVSPSLNTRLSVGSGNVASILFDKQGKYIVTAAYANNTASRTVNVGDVVYGLDTAKYTIVPLTDDQITLTPSISANQSDSALIITATTTNKYSCLNNFISTDIKYSPNAYAVNFTGSSYPTYNCTAGQIVSTASFYLMSIYDGQYALSVTLNNTVYSGSYIKKGGNYTFTWSYTSGILLSPLSITK